VRPATTSRRFVPSMTSCLRVRPSPPISTHKSSSGTKLTVVSMADENALATRGEAFATTRSVMLVMAYGVVKSMHPFHDLNNYRIYLPDGTLADEYIKRHPVPGVTESPVPPSESSGVSAPECVTPLPNRLVCDQDAALGEEVFDVAETQTEAKVEPDGVGNDVGGESISVVARRRSIHPVTVMPRTLT
jgi:hypothetical protein